MWEWSSYFVAALLSQPLFTRIPMRKSPSKGLHPCINLVDQGSSSALINKKRVTQKLSE